MTPLKLSVKTFRAAGLEARWSRTRNGAPMIVVRNPNAKHKHQREQWWMIDQSLFDHMQTDGILKAFDNHTLLGDVFSIPA